MAVITPDRAAATASPETPSVRNPAFQAFLLLRSAFTVAPILAALDNFAHVLVDWPRFGGYLVAAWLGGIIVNLLLQGDYYDIALRDFGLAVGALALARLATAFPNALWRR